MVKKGYMEERDLVNKLWDLGFASLRVPASGGATKKPMPDVIAGNSDIYLTIEVKTTTKDKIYINSEQINELYEFSKIFGAEPYIGVKFKYTKWLFISPNSCPKTDKGNYKIEKEYMIANGLEIGEITGSYKQSKLL